MLVIKFMDRMESIHLVWTASRGEWCEPHRTYHKQPKVYGEVNRSPVQVCTSLSQFSIEYTATAETVDEVSIYHMAPHSVDGLDIQTAKDPLMSPHAQHFHNTQQRTQRQVTGLIEPIGRMVVH
jgi:hypothetical protein